MAEEKKKRKKPRGEGRISQMIQVYKTTKQHDRKLPWLMLLSFVAPVIVSVVVAALLPGGWLKWILWVITGLLFGLLIALIVLGRRAERTAYEQIEGRQGAVGAVINSGLRGTWRGNEQPVAIVPRSGEAVYRVVGKGGVVMISEGDPARVRRLVQEETRKVARVLPNVTITQIHVGRDEGQVPLPDLVKALKKTPRSLRRAEIQAVYQRLSSLRQEPLGIPKGIDPMRIRRPGKPR